MSTQIPKSTNVVFEPQAGQPTNFRQGGCPAAALDEKAAVLNFGGCICVVGRLNGGNQPNFARAFVYRDPTDAPLVPDSNAAIGVCGDFQNPSSHHYRFIESDPADEGTDHVVPCARDNHTGNDDENFLVIWTSEDGSTWQRWPAVQFIGRGDENRTECDPGDFESKDAKPIA
ncbi:MAG: hypothetical protein ACI9G1_001866 [Pirellulaceae bacterium]|jgi:hypothetical protein